MKFLLALIGVLVAQTRSQSANPNKLLLTVYYESKCPDSKKFIVEQLVPTISQMQDYVQLKLVPFGKAQSINHGRNGFECQHGPTECRGNIVQDCALNLMAGRSDVERVNYVACEMQTQAGTIGNLQCVKNARLPEQNVQQCMHSKQGIDLQLISEHLTNLLKPKFIPTVTIDGYFDQRIQDQSQKNLFGTLCGLIPDAPPCARHYNHTALQNLF